MFSERSRTGRRWTLTAADDAAAAALGTALGVHPVAARVFAGRGLPLAFFSPSRSGLEDPGRLLGIERALARLESARKGAESIRLVTDYDVDGTTSCLILHATLDRLGGAAISYHIPDRFTEGYGLSMRAVETAAADGVRVLVTADIGVRDHVTVRRAKELGIDVIVCDHHLPPGESVPPDALAVLCPPQIGCGYPNKALAACGVSLKLATALLEHDPRREEILDSLLKLAAVGTVADIVDLATAENRAVVSLGLESLNRGRHGPGLAALLEVAGAEPGKITAETLGWRIGPRINAAGRLADASSVVRLLRERDPAAARAQAARLDELNRERQEVQQRCLDQAGERIPAEVPPFLVVAGTEEDGFHRGVVGIVAAKLREAHGRPAAVVSVLGKFATGSIRSVPNIHATHALDSVAPLLHRYGGHAAAAGFSLDADKLPAFQEGLSQYVTDHGGDDALVQDDRVDAVVNPADIDVRLVRDLARMEPCGKGNEKPRLVVRGTATDVRTMKERHLSFRLDRLRVVWWGGAEQRALLDGATLFCGHASLNEWNGNTSAEFVLDDLA